MVNTDLVAALASHQFLQGLDPADLDALGGCGGSRHVPAGAHLAREGEPAEHFHLVTSGRVGIEAHVPRRGAVVISTLDVGDVFGWSWLYPPHRWDFDAVAMDDVDEVVLGVEPLRRVLAERPALDAELTRRLGAVLAARLQSARTQLLDLYGRVP
jgi:CRP/FNR family transcriptional regulator, cyclic AMP receptor protein